MEKGINETAQNVFLPNYSNSLMIGMSWDEDSRKRIPMKVKHAVYRRAKGRCEKCRRSLEMKHGDFHHTRDPKDIPRAKTVEFLCPTCHKIYGHEWKTRKEETFWGIEKITRIFRKSARKQPTSKKKTPEKTKKKRKTKKKTVKLKTVRKPKYSSLSKEELLRKLTVKKLKQLAKENKVSLTVEGFWDYVQASTKEEIIDILSESRKVSKKKVIAKLKA